ncbi:MAG: hypothetical protein O2820_20315 [Planctomycetota bacterium]|nr:hypothetical protein [Planctomycetota bacterium]
MQKKYPQTVKAISLNVDHDEEGEPSQELQKEVLDKLTELNLNVTNILSSTIFDDVLDRRDIFGVPAALVFSADGKLLKKFDGGFSYEEDVIPLIEETLKKSTGD